MSEVWKNVVGFEDYFKVSNTGKVWSLRSNKLLKQCKNKAGYMTITTRIGGRLGKVHCFKVHRLVAEAFISNDESKPYVNHKNSNRSDNNSCNLEWVTSKENHQHGVNFGYINWEHRRGFSRLSSSDIAEIRENPEGLSQRVLAHTFGVSKTFVHSLQNGLCLNSV